MNAVRILAVLVFCVHVPAQTQEKVQNPMEASDALTKKAERVYPILKDAFNTGGDTFLAHAQNYHDAMVGLETLLNQNTRDRNAIAQAFDRIGAVLERSQLMLLKIDLEAFDKIYAETVTVVLHSDLLEAQTAKTNAVKILEQLHDLSKDRRLTDTENSRQNEAQSVIVMADERIKSISATENLLQGLKEAVANRNQLVKEMADVHRHWAGVYRNIARLFRDAKDLRSAIRMFDNISNESKTMERKFQNAGNNMNKVLDTLEKELVTRK